MWQNEWVQWVHFIVSCWIHIFCFHPLFCFISPFIYFTVLMFSISFSVCSYCKCSSSCLWMQIKSLSVDGKKNDPAHFFRRSLDVWIVGLVHWTCQDEAGVSPYEQHYLDSRRRFLRNRSSSRRRTAGDCGGGEMMPLHFIRIAQWHFTNAKYVCIMMTQKSSGHSHPSHKSNHSMILIHRTVRLWSVPSFMSIKLPSVSVCSIKAGSWSAAHQTSSH